MKLTVKALVLVGIVPAVVPVVVEVGPGEAPFTINGLPEVHVREARIRCRAALQQVGVDLAKHKVTVTVEMPSGAYGTVDLAIAYGVLAALGKVSTEESTVFVGELSLTGAVRSVRGIAPYVIAANALGFARIVLPLVNRLEAAHASAHAGGHTKVVTVETLHDAPEENGRELPTLPTYRAAMNAPDLADVRGLHSAKRALEVAAVGGHSILFIASPGTGATMLARRLTTILPLMTAEEQAEATSICSVAGLLRTEVGWVYERPFRAPHHTCSAAGLLGGGHPPRPGELSLATHGIILLDELAEFRRTVLDEVAAVLKKGEHKVITRLEVADAKAWASFPVAPFVIGVVGPCPCGYHGVTSTKPCQCSPERIEQHFARLRASKLWGHFDLHVRLIESLPPHPDDARIIERGETSATVRARVVAARARLSAVLGNDLAERNRIRKLAREFARGSSEAELERVIAVARTIARVDGCAAVSQAHVAEAQGLRMVVKEEVAS